MSLQSRLTALAHRIRDEFNAVRNDLQNIIGSSEDPITALPIDWSDGLIKVFSLTADVTPIINDFQNPSVTKAHLIILKNNSGATRTFTLPNSSQHKFETAAITVANNKRRALSGLYVDGAYHWAVGPELNL